MIQYSLVCESKHTFDAWFRNAEAFEAQAKAGDLSCPVCQSTHVEKALMAPAVSKGGRETLAAPHPERRDMLEVMRALRKKILADADYVGPRFAEEARKIHYAEVEPRGIYGEADREEVEALAEEGIGLMPIPHLPDEHN